MTLPFSPWGVTCRCGSVNITGSIKKTLLDSLLIEAAMICEFTTSECPVEPLSPPIRTVEFSVDKNRPRLLYKTKTTFTTPGVEQQRVLDKAN
uniref:Uncharacterized protein n=1 Tax=Leptobrachium leishanense TaxID=445787 RepID=A0A8C5Q760_9ANUR